jgi:hypothetical protein
MPRLLRSIPPAIVLALIAFASSAQEWDWVSVVAGSSIGVSRGKAVVERKGSRVIAVLRESEWPEYPATLSARLRNGNLSGRLDRSLSDNSPDFLSRGRWEVHKTEAGETLEKIFLYHRVTGNYLVLARFTRRGGKD